MLNVMRNVCALFATCQLLFEVFEDYACKISSTAVYTKLLPNKSNLRYIKVLGFQIFDGRSD